MEFLACKNVFCIITNHSILCTCQYSFTSLLNDISRSISQCTTEVLHKKYKPVHYLTKLHQCCCCLLFFLLFFINCPAFLLHLQFHDRCYHPSITPETKLPQKLKVASTQNGRGVFFISEIYTSQILTEKNTMTLQVVHSGHNVVVQI